MATEEQRAANRERNRRYRERHRAEIQARQRTWREVNRDRLLADDRNRYERDREERLAAERERYRDDPEFAARIRARSARREREKRSEIRAWRQRNRDRINERTRERYRGPAGQARMAANAARRALTLGSPAEAVDRLVVWERDEGVCGICGLAADPQDWHLDHVTPLACGGAHSYANVQVSHPFCNLSKREGRGI